MRRLHRLEWRSEVVAAFFVSREPGMQRRLIRRADARRQFQTAADKPPEFEPARFSHSWTTGLVGSEYRSIVRRASLQEFQETLAPIALWLGTWRHRASRS